MLEVWAGLAHQSAHDERDTVKFEGVPKWLHKGGAGWQRGRGRTSSGPARRIVSTRRSTRYIVGVTQTVLLARMSFCRKLPKDLHKTPLYTPGTGPQAPHHRTKDLTNSTRPLVYLNDVQMLLQPLLPPLRGQVGFTGDQPTTEGSRPRPGPDHLPEYNTEVPDSSPVFLSQTTAQTPDHTCHARKREKQGAFLNPLGSSMRQSASAARHDIINFLYCQAELLAEERLDALRLFELHMEVVEDLSRQHASEVAEWSRLATKSTRGPPRVFISMNPQRVLLTIDNVLMGRIGEEQVRLAREQGGESRGAVAEWIHDGIQIEGNKSHREHPIEDTWTSITKLRDALNPALKKFREQQRAIYPRLKLSGLDIDEPELTAIQLPLYCMKHGQRDVDEDGGLRAAEIKLRCSQAESGIVAGAGRKFTYTAQLANGRDALVHLGHMAKDAMEPYLLLTHRGTRQKETHLHGATGDWRLFDGTAWYLQSGVTLKRPSAVWALSPTKRLREDDDETEFLMGTQTMKRASRTGSPRKRKRPRGLKDIAPEDVVMESSASEAEMSPSKGAIGKLPARKKKAPKRDGWIWMESMALHVAGVSDEKLVAYKKEKEGDRVQWFHAEAEMYRWLELYEWKHAELCRVITRFERDGVVWAGRADHTQSKNGGVMDGAVTCLQHNTVIIFKSADSGVHHDWASSTSYDKLVTKIDGWRDVVFKWMDGMGIYRVYKDF
ncbi:hypothetical protein C8R43DRAFT_944924 [Mycena crocata]|nr:hypothetical protein C8R43DRAFT_944924 [Mycena crocata]